LITGCTGFLGKVLLEKIIRTCVDYKRIYVMIRGKKGMKIEDRFKRDVLGSHIFKVLFYNRPELMKVVAEKVVPI
jgi:fatty acyl-CoA reductase